MTWNHTKLAAHHAALHPSVWAPLVGAAIFSIDDLDKRTSKDLADNNPIFGNKDAAQKTSDDLQNLLVITAGVSAFIVPTNDSDSNVLDHGDHLGVVLSGIALTGGATEILKSTTKRERPNNKNSNSFPSGHASAAFASATFASANAHRAWGNSSAAQWADATLYSAASLTALARVEAEKHYPSDVLVGAALGNFMARFLDELLLTQSSTVSLSTYYDGKTIVLGVEQKF